MSKEYVMQLEATIENLKRDNKIIKEELSKYKTIDNVKPNEALKCLEYIKRFKSGYDEVADTEEYTTIKQTLITKSKKELVSDIITNKLINYRKFYSDFIMSNISYDKYVEYWTSYGCEQLTEQEFNLLKEMSNNE